ncbi:unknown [Coprococcus eutactus CAG:665]|nr:unknown [Coprococcus eutactus CAG:665]
MPLLRLSLGIQLDEVFCHLINVSLDSVSDLLPFISAKAVYLRRSALLAPVLLYPVGFRCQDIEFATLGILYNQIILECAVHLYLLYTLIDSYSILLVYDIITHTDIRK